MCLVDSYSYLMKEWHPRFDSVLLARLECPSNLPETLNGLHNYKNNRHEKLAGGSLNLLAAAVGLSSIKSGMKIYEVGKCPVMLATFPFNLLSANHKRWIQTGSEVGWSFSGNTSSTTKICDKLMCWLLLWPRQFKGSMALYKSLFNCVINDIGKRKPYHHKWDTAWFFVSLHEK